MNRYGVRDVEKLLHLSRSTIRALVAAGFVSPARGARGAWRFSFQDLIVLRTAQTLADAKVPQRRITKSVRELRRQIPDTMPLSGLSISAVGDRIVVRERGGRWQADSGQYLLEFDADHLATVPRTIERAATLDRHAAAQETFDEAVVLEAQDRDAALAAYARAIELDPHFVDAYINLGRMLHEAKRYPNAEHVYREGVKACSDAVLHFNLGVLLDDTGRKAEAAAAYERAVALDPELADGHYNLGLLCQELARPKDAIRHMARYRALTAGRTK